MKPLNLVGQRFGKLLVLEKVPSIKKQSAFFCMCDCGVGKVIIGSELNRGNYKSCGCNRTPRTTHEYRDHPLYDIWKGMKARCYDKNHSSYRAYGAAGVTVCNEWKNNFKAFYDWCIANGWERGLQIDKDKKAKEKGFCKGAYSPELCSIVTCKENNRERSSTKLSLQKAEEIRSSSLKNKELAKKYSVSESTIFRVKSKKRWA